MGSSLMRPRTDTLRTRGAAAALCALLAGSAVAAAPTPPSASDIAQKGPAGLAACSSCHGMHGEGMSATGAPRIAGLPAPYLLEQLNDFADGSRQNAVMAAVARPLEAAQRAQLAQFYATQRPPPPPAGGTASADDDTLAQRGRWVQELPACVQCHSGRGVGVFPPLAGQSAAYLSAQLGAFRAGTRQGDRLGLMHGIAAKLSDADIGAVASYFATQRDPRSTPRLPVGSAAPESPDIGGKGVFQPSDTPINDEGFRQVVQLGLNVFEDPRKYASRFVGNDLSCSSCHLDAGRRVGSAPLWAAYVSYPAWRAKTHQVNTFAERLQGCFQYSMNGRAPPLGDPILVALESYAYWMARGAPVDPNISGRGYLRPAKAPLAPNPARGAKVYESKCALCHGTSGAGQHDDEGAALFPALWGSNSYNWGAGMANISNAAGFIKSNMPFSQGNTLSDQDAWDVAWYVDSRERGQDPRFTNSVAQTRALYHDTEDSLYGKRVDGYLLGSKAPAPGGHAPRAPRAAPEPPTPAH
jgi:thiosulfate dehydrogenase